MYWYFVLAALAAAFCGCIVYFKKNKIDIIEATLRQIILFSMILCFIVTLVLCIIIYPISFRQFEEKYKLQEELYNIISAEGNYVATASIIEINQELFNFQASKRFYGNWSLLPARVLDIKPIGY